MTAADWLTRNGRYVAAGVLALGLAVRLRHYLAGPSYWYDEAYLLVNIFDKSLAELTGPLRCDQAAPPLFLWALRGLYLFVGRSEWAMRLPAFLASVLAMPLMIPLARRFAGPASWMWAVGLVALSQTAAFLTINAKPYAGDLLATEVAFLAGVWCIAREQNIGPLFVLFAVGILLPWFSYPSIFALSGVSLGLVADALCRRSAGRGIAALIYSLIWVASFALAWRLVGRHQHSENLGEYWQPFFLDLSSVSGALGWFARFAVRAGNYATTGMGLPLLILALLGSISLVRRAPELLCLPLGMFATALLANALHRYPLEDRLVFFAAPGLWLLAAAGVGVLLERLPGRRGCLAALLLAVILAPGVVRYAYWLAVVPSKVEFREAIEFVEQHRQEDDVWWLSHPEVFEVYRGKEEVCLSGLTPRDEVERCCPGHRVWIIAPPGWELPPALRELDYHALARQEFQTLTVTHYAPR